jgi:hypothetical protein
VRVPRPPVDIPRDAAQRAAADELSGSRYEDESLLERAWRWFEEFLLDLFAGSGGVGGFVSLVILGLVLAFLAAGLSWSLRRMAGRGRPRRRQIFSLQAQTAAMHRANAERLAEEARWAEAIQERLRAVARGLEEREILTAMPGRTADELAAVAGEALPAHGEDLRWAADVFDAVTYGQDAGDGAAYAALVELDRVIALAEPVVSGP